MATPTATCSRCRLREADCLASGRGDSTPSPSSTARAGHPPDADGGQAGWGWGGARAWSGVTQACDPARARPLRCPAHRQHPPATAAAKMASSGSRRPRGLGRSATGRSACAPSRNAAGWIPGCERLVARKSARWPVEGAARPPVHSDTSTTARAKKTLVPCCCRFTRIAARPYWIRRQTPTCRGRPGNRTIGHLARSPWPAVREALTHLAVLAEPLGDLPTATWRPCRSAWPPERSRGPDR